MEDAVKQTTKALLIKYGSCFGVAALITFVVFWIRGFFTDSISVNMQVLSDGFSISGMIFLFLAAMMYISGEGALIGVSYILQSVAQIFIPMGRKNHEVYAKYRERKLAEKKKPSGDHCLLVTGSIFFAVGLIFTVIWYVKFYI